MYMHLCIFFCIFNDYSMLYIRFYRDHVDSSDHCIRNREEFLQIHQLLLQKGYELPLQLLFTHAFRFHK